MAEQKLLLREYYSGISTEGERKGKPASGRFVKNLNPFESVDYITLSRAATKVSGATVDGLIIWMKDASPFDTNRYFYDGSGALYKETSGGTWSKIRTVTGASGEGLSVFNDYLYYMLPTEIGRYGRLTGTPAFDDDLTSWWDAAISDIQTTGGGTGESDYVPPTTIAETATARQTFTAEHDPLKEITIDVDVPGTGNWTVTVHDAENNTIGTKTLANASVTAADITFTFSTALRLIIGNEYHFHVTSTVADGGVDTGVTTDLEGAEFVVEYGVLIGETEFHDSIVVEDKLIICNRDYLAVYDEATYDPNKILLDRGYEAVSMTKVNEYVAITAYKGSSISTAEESKIFYWDTISPSWNFVTDTTSIGVGNSISNKGNVFHGIFGNKGAFYEGDNPSVKQISHAPKLKKGKKVNVYPQGVAHLDGVTLIAMGYTDDDSSLEQGIYAYGSSSSIVSDGLVLLHTISTGTTQSSDVEIGMINVVGEYVYFSWMDDTSYGVDKISPDSSAVASGVYESLVFDNGDNNREKMAIHQVTRYEALASGESITNKSKFDKAATFTDGTASDTDGDTKVKDLFNKRFNENEIGFTIASTDGTFPKVTQHELLFNDLSEEKNAD